MTGQTQLWPLCREENIDVDPLAIITGIIICRSVWSRLHEAAEDRLTASSQAGGRGPTELCLSVPAVRGHPPPEAGPAQAAWISLDIRDKAKTERPQAASA